MVSISFFNLLTISNIVEMKENTSLTYTYTAFVENNSG